MKKLMYLAVATLGLAAFSGCTTYNYYTAAINKSNLSNYHTFAWMPQARNGNTPMGQEADTRIKDATTFDLSSKGLQLSQRNPDLIVNYTAKVGRGTYTNYYTPNWSPGWGLGWGWGWGWRYRPYYYAYGAPFLYGDVTFSDQEHYKEGTLIIDLIDARTHKIVWRGFGVGEVHHNRQKDVEDLPKVVNGILSQLQIAPGHYGQYRYRQS